MRIVPALAVVCLLASSIFADAPTQSVYNKIKIRFPKNEAADRRMVDKDVDLVFDDAAKRLTTRGEYLPLDIRYDQVEKVVFDVSVHMRGGAMSQVIGGVVGVAMAAQRVHDYWFLIQYKDGDAAKTYLMEVDKDHAEEIIAHARTIFRDKVQETPILIGGDVEKNTLADLQSKHDVEVDKKTHPLPEPKSDKALVVVACPSLAARYAGKGIQFKVHANDKVIAVNKWGTYAFAYLEPGNYKLVSQSENANGFDVQLEAGKEYYFFQNTFMGAWKARTGLSQQSKERVLQEINGSFYSDWKRK